jgi:hypothetical protein
VAKLFVPIVQPRPCGVLAEVMDHVADVMQQCRGDHGAGMPIALRKPRRLQGVLLLADGAQAIAALGADLEDVADFGSECLCVGHECSFDAHWSAPAVSSNLMRQVVPVERPDRCQRIVMWMKSLRHARDTPAH